MRKFFVLIALLISVVPLKATAQRLKLKGTLSDGDAMAMELSAKPVDDKGDVVRLTADGKMFTGDVPLSRVGLYTIYGKHKGGQLIVPFYSMKGATACDLKIDFTDGFPAVLDGDDNKALSAFNRLVHDKGLYMWQNGKDSLVARSMPEFIRSYTVAADSLLQLYDCATETADYLRLWAYTTAFSSYDMLPRALGVKPSRLAFKPTDVLPGASLMLDTPMASLFPMSTYIVSRYIPKGTAEQRLAWLYANYKCDSIRSAVRDGILEHYITTFNFEGDFDGGLAALERMVNNYDASPRYVDEFKKRRSCAQGADFPDNVELVDVDGKTVSFKQFRGRYVYVDLWASWCVPCIREIPHLQALEKELAGRDVVFVSISLDEKAGSWLTKMKALNMRGNQLLNSDNTLAEALNVRGIPRFLIYDKQGKLYSTDAPRPSDPRLRELLLSLE